MRFLLPLFSLLLLAGCDGQLFCITENCSQLPPGLQVEPDEDDIGGDLDVDDLGGDEDDGADANDFADDDDEAICGNGQVEEGELCDGGSDADLLGGCTPDCDGYVPTIVAPDISVNALLHFEIQLTADAHAPSELSFTAVLPTYASLEDLGNGTVRLSVDPIVETASPFPASITVSNANHSTTTEFTISVLPPPPDDALCINEFSAASDAPLDEDGDSPDWIELYNYGLLDVELGGWCLEDSVDIWCFQSRTVSPGEYLIVFASDKDRHTEPLHTNFKLKASGEYLGLLKPDGSVACETSPEYPSQYDGLSYGLAADGTYQYFSMPTPGAQNADGIAQLHPPEFVFAPDRVVAVGDVALSSLTATDEDGDPLLIAFLDAPDFVTLSSQENGEARIQIAPVAGDEGSHVVEAIVDDGILLRTEKFKVDVITATNAISTWSSLHLQIGDLHFAVDDAGKRLFFSVSNGAAPDDGTITEELFYAHNGNGFTVAVGPDAEASPGDVLTIPNVTANGSTDVNLFQMGMLVDTYKLIFTPVPVIDIEAATIVDEPKNPGTLRVLEGGDETKVLGMGIEIRGGTAQFFDKKSFAFELRESDGVSSKPRRLLDLRDAADWQLDAAYRDQAFVRNVVSHDIFREMRTSAYVDPNGIPQGKSAISGTPVEVVLNHQYHGLYILQERPDRKLVSLPKVTAPLDGDGFEQWNWVDYTLPENDSLLFKAQTNEADFYHPDSVALDFEQKYPDQDDVNRFVPLQQLISFVNDANDATFVAEIGDRVDLENLVDFWILRLVASNPDTLKKNYYLARGHHQKFFFVPWDFDATYGISWTGDASPSTTLWWPDQNLLLSRLVETSGTGFRSMVKARWLELRGTGLLTATALESRFVDHLDILGVTSASVESSRSRNLSRWPESGGNGSHDPTLGELSYIGPWINDRLTWLDTKVSELTDDP